jgi:ribosomal protein L31E
MAAGRASHIRLRRSKSKPSRERASKSYKLLAGGITDHEEANQVELTHSLLLASLRFWEVERDLIEERKAAIGL